MAKLSMNPGYSNGYDRGYQDALDEALDALATLYTKISAIDGYNEYLQIASNNTAIHNAQNKLIELKEAKDV